MRQQLGGVLGAGELHRPVDAGGGREHHAHLVPQSRQAVTERVHGLGGVRQEFRRDQEQHARGAQRQERIARLDDADARGARGVVATAARHRNRIHAPVRGHFLAQLAGDVRAFHEARHVRFVETRGGQHFGRPFALRHVHPQRAGGIRAIAGLLARHQQANVVLGQQHAARVLEHRGLVLAHPDQLGRGEARHGDVAGDLAASAARPSRAWRTAARCGRRSRGWPGAAACRWRPAASRHASGPKGPRPCTALRVAAGSAFTAALVALHQSAGFCSDHPAWGRDTFSGAEACSTTVSLSSTMTALTLDVPISMPRYIHPR